MYNILKFLSNYSDASMSIDINTNRTVATLNETRGGSNSSVTHYNIIDGFIIAVPSYTT